MGARDQILNKLRKAQQPFTGRPAIENRRHMVPETQLSQEQMIEQFSAEAKKLGCYVYHLNPSDSFEQIMELVGDDKSILSWDEVHIPLDGLHDNLKSVGVTVADNNNGQVRTGITGVSSAFAATGSLVLQSGAGQYRNTSLLPDLHIAILTPDQMLPDFEVWQQQQQTQGYPAFTQASNTTIVTGPSKTADIAQELVKGAHGPREVHIIILENTQ
jgi:L-lactate dehydrogenase complex protein LldG